MRDYWGAPLEAKGEKNTHTNTGDLEGPRLQYLGFYGPCGNWIQDTHLQGGRRYNPNYAPY